MSTVTVIIDKDQRLTGIVVSDDGPAAHLVRDLGDEKTEEAILMYDQARDPVVRGYGRSRLTSYGPEFAFQPNIISTQSTKPDQPQGDET